MAKISNMILTGKSGRKYDLIVYTRDTTFKALAAVYVMSKRNPNGNHDICYIGQTGDL